MTGTDALRTLPGAFVMMVANALALAGGGRIEDVTLGYAVEYPAPLVFRRFPDIGGGAFRSEAQTSSNVYADEHAFIEHVWDWSPAAMSFEEFLTIEADTSADADGCDSGQHVKEGSIALEKFTNALGVVGYCIQRTIVEERYDGSTPPWERTELLIAYEVRALSDHDYRAVVFNYNDPRWEGIMDAVAGTFHRLQVAP